MLRVHEELTTLQGHRDRWRSSPTALKRNRRALFQRARLRYVPTPCYRAGYMKALFAAASPAATSDTPPDELYRNSRRHRFTGNRRHQQHCDAMNVDAGIDYRLRTLSAHLWLSPLNNDTREQMDKLSARAGGAARCRTDAGD